MEQTTKTYQRKGNAERAAEKALAETGIAYIVLQNQETKLYSIAPEQQSPAIKRSIIKDGYRALYGDAENCGDQLARKLCSLRLADGSTDHVALRVIASANGIDVEARWGHLNPGQQRMNLGNVLRGMMNRGEEVKLEIAGH